MKTHPNIESPLLKKVEELARQVVAREGCEFYDAEFASQAGQRVLRVYIDKAEGQVGVEDCVHVSRGLNLLLDVDDVIPGGRYHLEVSSPGLDRVLRKPQHFQKVIGQKISLKLERALGEYGILDPAYVKAKQVGGLLQEFSVSQSGDYELSVQVSETVTARIPWSAVKKAKLVFEFGAEKGVRSQKGR